MKIKWHKLKIFDKQVIRRMFGWQLTGLATAMAMVTYPTHAFDYRVEELAPIQAEVVVATDQPYQFPVETLTGVSQGYHVLHAGVDLRAPKGTRVVSVESGVVIEVKRMVVGYGHFVRVAHNGTMSSLYAHLDQVAVVAGQKVTKGEQLGTVGLTGWTTGPHLHFEIYEGNKSVNPMKFIAR